MSLNQIPSGSKSPGFQQIPNSLTWLIAVGVGLLGTAFFHIQQLSSHFDTFPGDRGDARLVVYIMEHWFQVFRGAESWLSPGMFYPVHGTLGYADMMFGYGLFYSVLRSLGMGLFEAAEVTVIFLNFLNYFVCFVLLHKVLRFNLVAACAGAVFFAFNSPKLVQIGHVQLQPMLALPLVLIFVILFVKKQATLTQKSAFGLLAGAALALDLQLQTGFYAGWFLIFWSFLFLAAALLFSQTRLFIGTLVKRFWPALVATIPVFILGLIPFLIVYVPILTSTGGRPWDEALKLTPIPWSLLVMGEQNWLWGNLAATIQTTHPMHPELQIAIGLIPSLVWIGITVLGAWLLFRAKRHRDNPTYLFLALLILATDIVYLIGMRYSGTFTPWEAVYYYFPGGRGIRAVARYVLLLALPMSIAFAFLIQLATQTITSIANRGRSVLAFFVLLLVVGFALAEQFGRREGYSGFSIRNENSYLNQLAQGLPSGCDAFYVDVGPSALHPQFEYQVDAIFVSMMKRVPTINGYSGQLPADWRLWEVADPGYEQNARSWISLHRLNGNICRLVINESRPNSDLTDPAFFVSQQYRDVLGREPDAVGFASWHKLLTGCKALGGRTSDDPTCDRVAVQMGMFGSQEFLQRSYFVLRLYQVAFGRMPTAEEFKAERRKLATAATQEEADTRKESLVGDMIQTPEFRQRYDGLSNANYAGALLRNVGVPGNPVSFVADLDANRKTRGQILHELAEDPGVFQAVQKRAFVVMQFFANLGRDPKPQEFKQRLHALEVTEDYRQLVFDFIYSAEYRRRFGYLN
jgi:hypothetical protein